jgi:dihydropteroate synthase
MGVLNVTPDSFSDGGRFFRPEEAIAHGLQLLEEGADILDVGGESTRPGVLVAAAQGGGPALSAPEELERILGVIEGILRAKADAVVSVDTYKAEVARQVIAAGAEIINDVSAFEWDPDMAATCAALHCGVVMMHTRGRPTEWKQLPAAENILALVELDLANHVQLALGAGVDRRAIVLDPGFGFGKNYEENYSLLANFGQFHRMGFPLLAGASRKSFLGKAVTRRSGCELAAAERLSSSLAAMVACILQGAHMVRVHDVKASVEAAAVADAILEAQDISQPISSPII